MTELTTRNYTVQGMSCEHCRTSVIEELSEVEGVDSVAVDLESGRVTVRGEAFTDVAVATAVTAAGYRVVASE